MKRLVVYVSESEHQHGKPVWREVLDAMRKHGLHGATATRGLMGLGHTGKLHEALSPDVPPDLPITVEAMDEDAAIDAALPDVDALLTAGLIAVHDVEFLKIKVHPHKPAPGWWKRLTKG